MEARQKAEGEVTAKRKQQNSEKRAQKKSEMKSRMEGTKRKVRHSVVYVCIV